MDGSQCIEVTRLRAQFYYNADLAVAMDTGDCDRIKNLRVFEALCLCCRNVCVCGGRWAAGSLIKQDLHEACCPA